MAKENRKALAKIAYKALAERLLTTIDPHGPNKKIKNKDNDFVVLDMRDSGAYREGHVPGAINVKFDDIEKKAKELPKSKDLICYCYNITCFLAARSALKFAKLGFVAQDLFGGFEEWKNHGFDVEK